MNIANTAFECMLYNDFRRNVFESLLSSRFDAIDCGHLYAVREQADWSKEYSVKSGISTGAVVGTGLYSYTVIDTEGKDIATISKAPCANVVVNKRCVGTSSTVGSSIICDGGIIETTVEVKGYSACSSGDSESDRELVRRFKVHY